MKEIDGQIKGRRLTDVESMGMLYNDPYGYEEIISGLKEQEAVPVTQREIMHLLVWCCGSCGVAITEGDKFCRMCGRRMKWHG